ncbi:STE20-related kinase adapter protein alpha [Oopsacas minuta]|uniref:STE20-related kinase adapter protein alpha n=1 Tax=Oopsacas minuta TaxID=111878 RepID=A0AAV7JAM9_9METZ|nr:STE20-related kinase adapter protein alpha [Oopsacas minuta]
MDFPQDRPSPILYDAQMRIPTAVLKIPIKYTLEWQKCYSLRICIHPESNELYILTCKDKSSPGRLFVFQGNQLVRTVLMERLEYLIQDFIVSNHYMYVCQQNRYREDEWDHGLDIQYRISKLSNKGNILVEKRTGNIEAFCSFKDKVYSIQQRKMIVLDQDLQTIFEVEFPGNTYNVNITIKFDVVFILTYSQATYALGEVKIYIYSLHGDFISQTSTFIEEDYEYYHEKHFDMDTVGNIVYRCIYEDRNYQFHSTYFEKDYNELFFIRECNYRVKLFLDFKFKQMATVSRPASQSLYLSKDFHFSEIIGRSNSEKSTVYLAMNKRISSDFIVVRVINLELFTNEDYDLINNELSNMSNIRHPHIQHYITNMIVGPSIWVVLPFQHFGSCTDLMKSFFNNGFREEVIFYILRDVLLALNYLHGIKIIHRSICARHILIQRDGMVKLSGIRSSTNLFYKTNTSHAFFLPDQTLDIVCWMAPEVLAQDSLGYSYSADIYSIGITALELATGEAPFAGLPVTEIMLLKLKGASPPLSPELPHDFAFSTVFSQLVDLCIHHNPHKRPKPSELLCIPFFKLKKKFSRTQLPKLLRPVLPRIDKISTDTLPKGIDNISEPKKLINSNYTTNNHLWNFQVKS